MNAKHNKQSPGKWANAILLIVALQYLYLLYIDVSSMSRELRCYNCPFRLVSLLSYVDLLYLPVAIYLFYRHMRWGWILLFGTKLFTIVPSLQYYFHDYLPLPGAGIFPSFLLGVLVSVVVLVLMWKNEVCDMFTVNKRTKLLTVVVTGLLLLLVFLLK